MGLQEGLILLGAAVFILVLLDALRRKRAARRQADDYEDPEEAERRAQIARELPGLQDENPRHSAAQRELDPLFDKIEVFDDDPIPVLRNKLSPTDELSPQNQHNEHLEPDFSETTTGVDDDPLTETQWYEAETSFDDQSHQEEDEELAWERMRRQFELDPDFVAESQRSMQRQQRELQRLQERKQLHTEPDAEEIQAFEYENDLDDHFQSLDDLVDLELPAGMHSTSGAGLAKAPEKPQRMVTEAELAYSAAELEACLSAEDTEDTEDRENQLRAAFLMNLEKSAWAVAEEFLTINIQAPNDKPFPGAHLRKFMDIIGMRLSLSGFYHYVEEKDGQSVLGFSLVNMFTPGYFDAATLDDFNAAGLVLVMPLPNARQPMEVFERMLAIARVMEKNWGAELQDEQRSNLTQQTVEHYRQRIKDFEYKTRVKAKKASKK